ncbi:MAG: 5-deoxy-glucuronate isomerase [Acidimicrobiia bacterium]
MRLFHPNGSLRHEEDPIRIDAGEAGWEYCGLHVLTVPPGGARHLDLSGVEAAVVPLNGSCHVQTSDTELELTGRSSVFTGISDIAYVSVDTDLTIESPKGGRFALATARAEHHHPSFRVDAASVPVEVRGAGKATRQINELLSAEVAGPQRLIVVEVLTPEGNWSSYPPHKHDEWAEMEVPIEEIYYFEIGGQHGFGFHRTYTPDGEIDETVTVRSGDVFLVPRGYHGPCVAAPGYDMYYLNVMAGPDQARRWLITTDPEHAWVWEAWQDVAADPRLPMTQAH